MKNLSVTIITLLIFGHLNAQDWQVSIGTNGDDSPASLSISSNNDILIATNTDASGSDELMVTRLDSNGTVIWNNQYQGPTNESYTYDDLWMNSTAPAIISRTGSNGSCYVFGFEAALKLDINGNEIWTKSTDYGAGLLELSNGNILSSNGRAMINTAGDTLWTKNYEASSCWSFSPGVSFTRIIESGSEYISAGFAGEYGMLAKMDANGDTIWTSGNFTPGGPNGFSTGLAELSDGSIVISGSQNAGLYKTNIGGVPQWSGNITDGGTITIINVLPALDGGFFIAGTTNGQGFGNNDFFLIKADPNGVHQWSKTFGGPLNDEMTDAKMDLAGNIIMIGKTLNFGAANNDIYAVRVGQDSSLITCQSSQNANFNISSSSASVGCYGFASVGPVSITYTTSSSNNTSITLDNDTTVCDGQSVGIESGYLENNIFIYPNPSNVGFVNIKNAFNKDYKIYNALGILLDQGKIDNIIDLTKFNPGLYLIVIENNTFRIVKN